MQKSGNMQNMQHLHKTNIPTWWNSCRSRYKCVSLVTFKDWHSIQLMFTKRCFPSAMMCWRY